MSAQADIFTERDPWRQPLGWSLLFHGLVTAAIFTYAFITGGPGQSWGTGGTGGGAMSATLVSSASIPLPRNEMGKSIVAHESTGLTQSLPRQEEKAQEAIPIPEKNAKRKEPKPERSTTAKKMPEPEPENVVPFGQGGPISGPYGMFNAGGAKGGLSLTGGSGDFGNQFGYYVDIVRRKVSENWLKYEIDPRITSAQRVYLTFDILRNGEPANVQIEQSSGIPSLDISAVRAIQRIDTFGPLPDGYRGNKVSVEFWFDYRR